MVRFLKYIFLIFGGLAALLLTFFYIQNKEDLAIALDYKEKLSYEWISENCTSEIKSCFTNNFNEYASKVSLTGLSLGLKMGFNFLEDMKEKSSNPHKNIEYAIEHLKLNNTVIKYGNNRFHGFKQTYGGYIGKMRDFLDQADEFSLNLIKGLKEGKEGLSSLKNEEIRTKYSEGLERVEADYKKHRVFLRGFVNAEVKRLKKLYDVK